MPYAKPPETLESYCLTRGISDANALANYREINATGVLDHFGISVPSGTYIMSDPKQGSRQVRVNGKWLSAKGDKTLFAHNGPKLEINCKEVFITEGTAKMIALEQLGQATITLMGVTNWSERDNKDRRVLKTELAQALTGVDTVYLCFDADWQTNYNVVRELMLIHEALTSHAIVCHYTYWPYNAKTKGVDDKLASLPTVSERLQFVEALKAKPVKPNAVKSTFKALEKANNAKVQAERVAAETKSGCHIFDGSGPQRAWARDHISRYFGDLGYRKDAAGRIIRLVDGIWSQPCELEVAEIEREISAKLKIARKDGLIVLGSDSLTYMPPAPILKEVKPNLNMIRFLNGLYNLEDGTFQPEETETLGDTVRRNYEPTVELPNAALAYLAETVDADLSRVRAAIRYLIDPTIKAAKIVHLSGESGSGKGTIMNMVTAMLPKAEVFEMADPSVNMNDPTAMYNIAYGKRLVNIGDLDCKLGSIAAMLQMTGSASGEACNITVRPLHKQAFNAEVRLRFAISSVSQIRLSGSSDQGLMRRIFQLKTRKSPAAALFEGLSSVEANQLFNWVMGMDRNECERVLRNEQDLSQQYERLSQLSEEFTFFDGHFKLNPESKVPFTEVLELYRLWAETNQVRPVSRNTFTARAKACLAPFGVRFEAESGPDGKKTYVYGIEAATNDVSFVMRKLAPYTMSFEHPGNMEPEKCSTAPPEPTFLNKFVARIDELVEEEAESATVFVEPLPVANSTAPTPQNKPPGLEDADEPYIPSPYETGPLSPAGEWDWLPQEVQIYMEAIKLE